MRTMKIRLLFCLSFATLTFYVTRVIQLSVMRAFLSKARHGRLDELIKVICCEDRLLFMWLPPLPLLLAHSPIVLDCRC